MVILIQNKFTLIKKLKYFLHTCFKNHNLVDLYVDLRTIFYDPVIEPMSLGSNTNSLILKFMTLGFDTNFLIEF